MSKFTLSVVIIARNEAAHIGAAIESVLRATQACPQVEILLVDSASTDETVEIAKQYPISIVRLSAGHFLSAAAGRYIGMHYTNGDFLLHLDGDMELASGWLEKALPFMSAHPEAAGVDGYYHNIHIHDGRTLSEQIDCDASLEGPVEESFMYGAALYRRSALEKVGGFNPYLISEEEPELSIRLRSAGFKLFRLPYLLCTHYGPPENSLEYIVRRLRTNLWVGYGQVPRYHLRSGLFWMVLRERTLRTVLYLLGLLAGFVSLLLALVLQSFWPLMGFLSVFCVFFVIFWINKRSLRAVLKSMLLQTVVAYHAVRGFLMRPQPSSAYPLDVEVIQFQSCLKIQMDVRS